MISVLICGSSTPLRALLSGAPGKSSVRPISSVCRFGRDCRHLTNGKKIYALPPRPTVKNLGGRISTDLGTKKGGRYLTLVAKNVSARTAFVMALSFLILTSNVGLRLLGAGDSRRSHIHGINRNRIALHVMLSGSRNWIR